MPRLTQRGKLRPRERRCHIPLGVHPRSGRVRVFSSTLWSECPFPSLNPMGQRSFSSPSLTTLSGRGTLGGVP